MEGKWSKVQKKTIEIKIYPQKVQKIKQTQNQTDNNKTCKHITNQSKIKNKKNTKTNLGRQ